MKHDLMKAVPPTPARYLRKMDDTLKEIDDMQNLIKHRHRFGALAAILALLVALAGIAYAAQQSGILERLFPSTTPPPEVERAIVKQGAADAQAGLTLSIDEYLFDEGTLNVGWTVASKRDEPVFYLMDVSTSLDDRYIFSEEMSMFDPGEGVFRVLDGKDGRLGLKAAFSEYARITYRNRPNADPIDFTVTIYAFGTALEPVKSSYPFEIYEDRAQTKIFEDANQIGVSQDQRANVRNYRPIRDLPGTFDSSGNDYRPVPEDYAQAGLMTPIATLSAKVTIDPDNFPAFRHTEPKQRVYPYSGGRIEVDLLDFGPTGSRMEYWVFPDEGIIPDNYDSTVDQLGCMVLDGDGNRIDVFRMVSYGSSYRGGGGNNYITVTLEGGPLPEPPTSIQLMPALTWAQVDDAYANHTIPEGERIIIELTD